MAKKGGNKSVVAKKCKRCSLNCTIARSLVSSQVDKDKRELYIAENFGEKPTYNADTCPK